MWVLKEVPDNKFIFNKLGGYTCMEYCSIFEDDNGNICFVPDSLYQEFVARFEIEIKSKQ